MADQRISQLAPLPQASVQADQDVLAIVDLSASETKKVTAKELFQAGAQQADPASIPVAAIDTTAGIPADDINFTLGDVILGRDSSGPGQGLEILCTAAGRALLDDADASEQRITLGLGTLAIASGSWVDGSSFSGSSSGTNTGDQTISLSGAVIGSGTGAIVTTFGADVVGTAALADGAVTTVKLADDAVSAAKLGDNSSTVVGTAAPAAGGLFIGQQHVNQNNGFTYYYTGAAWAQTAGFTAITFNENTPFSHSVSFPTDANSPQIDITLDLQSPNTVWAGPPSGAAQAAPTFRALVGADLPAPIGTDKGAVYAGEGTVIEPTGELHLAPATTTTLGGVFVDGTVLTVDAAGHLQHALSLLPAGTYTKVTTDAKGHIVDQQLLEATDIPALDASKITSGTFDPARLAGKSVTREALADYAIAYIQESDPGIVTDHNGCLWLQESTGQLRMWNGNSWYPVGFGRLAQENLRWGGIVDASTDQVAIVTELGASAGLTVGNALPAATDTLSGLYVVVGTAGSAISVTPGITYDEGDWVLCVDQAQGWVRINTLTGGGGGPGTQYLNDLLDVTIATPQNNQVLTFDNASGQWLNKTSPAAPVTSVFGRTGAVVALEGDYSLNLLSDVDTATVPPSAGNVLRFNGTTNRWEPFAGSFSPTTTQGDLIQRGATADQRLAIGAANQVLHVNAAGTLAEWRALTAASTTAAGVSRLATNAETIAGALATVAVTPAGAKAAYLPLDLSTLPVLP